MSSGHLKEIIDFIGARVVEEPKMSLSRRLQ